MILILYMKINSFDLYGESSPCCRFFFRQWKARKVHPQQKMQQTKYQKNTEFVLKKKKKSMNIGFFQVSQSVLPVLLHLNFNKVIYVALVNSLSVIPVLFTSTEDFLYVVICLQVLSLETQLSSFSITSIISLQVECWFCSPMPEL